MPDNDTSVLIWPFNMASYEALCPKKHKVEMATGYCVFAPEEWTQFGYCPICKRNLVRQVCMDSMTFVAGPAHWEDVACPEEAIWRHDVLQHHQCKRCQDLAAFALAEVILQNLKGGATLEEVIKFVSDILGIKTE